MEARMLNRRLTAEETEARILECTSLPSLGSINFALQNILSRDDSSVQQISLNVSRDPSLTARVLKLTNSPFYGLRNKAQSLDDAIFYLGVAQIQRLVMVSPIIDQFKGVPESINFSWKDFWKHSMAVATVAQELLNFGSFSGDGDQSGYLAGLVHDVGKIAIAMTLPETFMTIQKSVVTTQRELRDVERDYLGLDHSEIGALYFRAQKLPSFLTNATRYHHCPSQADEDQKLAAIVNIADLAVRSAEIGSSGALTTVKSSTWKSLDAWGYVLPKASSKVLGRIQRNIDKQLFKLPELVNEMVDDQEFVRKARA